MIQKAGAADAAEAAILAGELWPGHEREELEEEMRTLLTSERAAIFLAREGAEPVGFAQCQLRSDYVEGTSSSPVGYLEGIYVRASFRGRGCARALLQACEQWALEQGCGEFASDCSLGNRESLAFHLSTGFREANRIICFVKTL